jgi:hypothetical protein
MSAPLASSPVPDHLDPFWREGCPQSREPIDGSGPDDDQRN